MRPRPPKPGGRGWVNPWRHLGAGPRGVPQTTAREIGRGVSAVAKGRLSGKPALRPAPLLAKHSTETGAEGTDPGYMQARSVT